MVITKTQGKDNLKINDKLVVRGEKHRYMRVIVNENNDYTTRKSDQE